MLFLLSKKKHHFYGYIIHSIKVYFVDEIEYNSNQLSECIYSYFSGDWVTLSYQIVKGNHKNWAYD